MRRQYSVTWPALNQSQSREGVEWVTIKYSFYPRFSSCKPGEPSTDSGCSDTAGSPQPNSPPPSEGDNSTTTTQPPSHPSFSTQMEPENSTTPTLWWWKPQPHPIYTTFTFPSNDSNSQEWTPKRQHNTNWRLNYQQTFFSQLLGNKRVIASIYLDPM